MRLGTAASAGAVREALMRSPRNEDVTGRARDACLGRTPSALAARALAPAVAQEQRRTRCQRRRARVVRSGSWRPGRRDAGFAISKRKRAIAARAARRECSVWAPPEYRAVCFAGSPPWEVCSERERHRDHQCGRGRPDQVVGGSERIAAVVALDREDGEEQNEQQEREHAGRSGCVGEHGCVPVGHAAASGRVRPTVRLQPKAQRGHAPWTWAARRTLALGTGRV